MFQVKTFHLLADKMGSILDKVVEEATTDIKSLYEDLKELVTRLL